MLGQQRSGHGLLREHQWKHVRAILTCVGMCWGMSVGAQLPDSSGAERQGDVIQRLQQERLRELQDRARPVDPVAQGEDLRRRAAPEVPVEQGGVCWPIDEVVVSGGERLSKATLKRLLEVNAQPCLRAQEIQQVLNWVTQDLFEQGEISTRAYLPEQNLGSRRLIIEVVPGVIAGYRQEGRAAQRIWVPGLFPSLGQILNLRDLEQGVEQINRLASQRATMDIEPGDSPGDSWVVLRSEGRVPWGAQLSFDNHGAEGTGKEAVSLNLIADAPLGLNERWVLTRRQSWPSGRGDHASRSTSLDLWLPVGYQSFGVNLGESDYVNVLSLPSGTPVRTDGRTRTLAISTERVVHRDQASRVHWLARISRQDARNRLAGEVLSSSSRTLTFAELGLGGSSLFHQGLVTGQLVWVQGTTWAGAERDAPGLPDQAPRAQSRKVALDMGYVRDLSLGSLSLHWSSQLSAQYAVTTLYGTQQMLLGSLGSVRGFSRQSLSGDHGVYWRHELAWPTRVSLGQKSVSMRWYAGLDAGWVKSKAEGAPSGSLGGWTLGASAQFEPVAVDVFVSQGLWRPSSFKRESAQVWARLSLAF